MTRGGGGVSQKVILHDKGEGGVQDPPEKDDIIYEQPQTDPPPTSSTTLSKNTNQNLIKV